MAWINTAASISLVNEFNAIAPQRRKESDGTIGDGEHATGVSDHNPDETGNTGGVEDADAINEVHARDVTSAGPWPAGWSMERFVQIVLARCRSGLETRLRYLIYNRRIWSASTGWVQRAYTGSNPHDHHAHFSFRYGSGAAGNPENNTLPWGLLAAVQANVKREVVMVDIDGKLPALQYGDNDPVIEGGTYWIKRAQRQLQVDDDGEYKDLTAAAVKKMMADDSSRSSSDGRKIGLPEWRRLYGIW